ncbi:DNA primase, partial [Candidatus Micrarchaeota archaeon]|nr:DNA primase [Candidatus Micrarchaeota archaeon]
MGKTYIDTVKYVVHTDLEIDGIVEKPDVVGAIFGQTEGLLGDELDLRELQKSGRIGRIEVNINTKSGKSIGEIVLPSSLDRVETAILSAALETVDRVGPCEAKIKVKTIEDTRTVKRDQVVNRAKFLLKGMMSEIMPERKEISELVREEVKLADVQAYGPEKLAAGPNIDDADHLIVVEGRADVLTMLKADIRNVICLQGKVVPKTVMELSHKKTMTVFVDGDRGGDLIIKQLADCAEIDFVAKAPDGKEVEELMGKEILMAL